MAAADGVGEPPRHEPDPGQDDAGQRPGGHRADAEEEAMQAEEAAVERHPEQPGHDADEQHQGKGLERGRRIAAHREAGSCPVSPRATITEQITATSVPL